MKTPYAILIGLALIAAAIFYREPSVSAAQAGGIKTKYMDGFKCVATPKYGAATCAILHGDQITYGLWRGGSKFPYIRQTYNWKKLVR
jgi:hypothetical protein